MTLQFHMLPPVGEDRFERLGPQEIQRLVTAWYAEQAPFRTVKITYEIVPALFGYAVRNDWLAREPLPQRTPGI